MIRKQDHSSRGAMHDRHGWRSAWARKFQRFGMSRWTWQQLDYAFWNYLLFLSFPQLIDSIRRRGAPPPSPTPLGATTVPNLQLHMVLRSYIYIRYIYACW